MFTYNDTEAYTSLARTSPDPSGLSLPTLLAESGNLAVLQREAVQLDSLLLEAIEQDMGAIANEIERMVAA